MEFREMQFQITVLRVDLHKDLAEKYLMNPLDACTIFHEGQTFMVGRDLRQPEGFCSHAWRPVADMLYTMSRRAVFPGLKDPDTMISACPDAWRPVTFELKRLG